MMKEVEIASMAQLLQTINELPNNFLFRGQANANWRLESSLERAVGASWSTAQAQKFEDYSIDQFQSKFHLYDKENTLPTSKLAWLSIMQHYGVPTRLIDFTESPYVALYFALEGFSAQSKSSLALYAIDYSSILENSIAHIKSKDSGFQETRKTVYKKQDEIFEKIVDRFSYDIAWIAEPKQLNARLDRQAGSFLLSGNRGLRVEQVLGSQLYMQTEFLKFVVSPELCSGVFALLRKMNITSKSIYGDLDGLARAIRMQMQIYSF
jgi:hypothetical protein